MKKIYLFLFVFATGYSSVAENLKPIAQKVADALLTNKKFEEVNLFTISDNNRQRSQQLESLVSDATVLTFNGTTASAMVSSRPSQISLIIPVNNGKNIELQLTRVEIFTPDFSVVTNESNGQPVSYTGGVHYWGIIKGDQLSLASISIFNNEVMGMISSPSIGNLVLGKIENDISSTHILYNDRNLHATPSMDCFTQNDNTGYQAKDLQSANKLLTNCIRIFWEVNVDVYTNKGNIANTANYVTGLFSQSAIIYANDAIPVELSEVFVWTTTSPYTSTSTSALLGQFQSYRNSMNGDLGNLLGYAGGGGIAAGFSGICAVNLDNSQCYSGIQSSYNNIPTYSWSVEVVTHEQGHLMGSRHTHACVWNGNFTAIDNCGPTAGYGYEGSCSGAPTPVGGGTIMSYCHLVGGVGINFSNGFGTQPKNVILNNFNGAACLTSCIGGACMPSATMSTAAILSSSATLNWAAVTNAITYNIRYRIVGSPTWLTGSSATNSFSAISLTAGSNYEWQVQTVCSGGNSIFTISTTFTTPPLTCVAPTGITTTSITSSSATFNWGAAGGATSYNVQYRIVGNPTWITGSSVTTSFNAAPLTASSNYEWQVQTVCSGGGTSSFTSSVLFSTTAPPCNTPVNNSTNSITSVTANFNWGAPGGAITYNIRYRIVGTSTWTNVADTVSPYNAIGLTPVSNYEWQIQAVCSQGTSSFSNSVNFTTLCAAPSAVITPGGPTTFCTGGNVLLTASSGAGYGYQWYQNGNILAGMVSMNYVASASGSFTVIVTSGACSATSSAVTVTVNPLPAVSAGNVSGCAGTQIALNGQPAGGNYSVANPYTGPGTTYTYTYTDASGCSNTSTAATITVNPLPTVTADPETACAGTPVLLASGSPAGGNYSVANPYTGPSTSYTYTFTDLNGCSNTSAPAGILINPLPTVSFTGLLSNYTTASPAATLTGTPPGGNFSGPGISGNTFDPAVAGAGGPYSITYDYTDGNGCSNSSVQQTTVTSCPVPVQPGTITLVSGAAKVCPGDSRPYKVAAVIGATGYTWTAPVGAIISAGQGTRFATVDYLGGFTTNGTLSVVAENSCGSSVARTKSITRNTPATPGTITGATSGVCSQSNVPYSVTAVSGITYNWFFNTGGVSVNSGQGSNSITASFTPGYSTGTLSVTAGNGCGTSSQRNLTVKSVPAFPGVISGTTSVCANQAGVPYSIAAVSGAATYTWSGPSGTRFSDGVVTSTVANLTTTANAVTVKFATTSGQIKVKANNSCGSSSQRTLQVNIVCRESQDQVEQNLVVYPNPASSSVQISFNSPSDEQYILKLRDMIGQVVCMKVISAITGENTTNLDIVNLSKGIYTVELEGNKSSYHKLVIQ